MLIINRRHEWLSAKCNCKLYGLNRSLYIFVWLSCNICSTKRMQTELLISTKSREMGALFHLSEATCECKQLKALKALARDISRNVFVSCYLFLSCAPCDSPHPLEKGVIVITTTITPNVIKDGHKRKIASSRNSLHHVIPTPE